MLKENLKKFDKKYRFKYRNFFYNNGVFAIWETSSEQKKYFVKYSPCIYAQITRVVQKVSVLIQKYYVQFAYVYFIDSFEAFGM